jgi:hypothetical protein
MGHSSCGCVDSLINDEENDENIFIAIFKHSILDNNKKIKIDK